MRRMQNIFAYLWLGVLVSLGAEKIIPGPKGGRLLENHAPRAEFFVEKDGQVTVTFYDEKLQPVPADQQSVAVIAQTKKGKETLEFERRGPVLVSKQPMPKGDGYTVVVQIRERPDAKPQNFRFKYETHVCGECKRVEYACICGH